MAIKKNTKINVGEFPYVDIMPTSRRNSIERGLARKKWIKIVSTGAVFAVLLSAGAVGFRFYEQMNQDSALSSQAAVESSIKTHAAVDTVLTLRDTLTRNVLRSSASTINWQDLMARIQNNLPSSSSIVSFETQTGGTLKDKPAIAVLVSIASTQPIAYSTVLESFGHINGLVDGSLEIGDLFAQGTADKGDVKYVYPVAFSVDSSILATNFDYLKTKTAAPKAPEKLKEKAIATPTPTPTATPTTQAGDSSTTKEGN